MTDLFAGQQAAIDKMIATVAREIEMRMHVYPRRVAAGKMSAATSDRQIEEMQAVLAFLQSRRNEP